MPQDKGMATSAPPDVPPQVRQLAFPVGRCQTYAPRFSVRTYDQVRQTGVRVRPPRLVTAHITASHMPWMARRSRVCDLKVKIREFSFFVT